MNTKIIVHTLIFNVHNELLILKRVKNQNAYPGWWDVPGGSLDLGEDPIDGARRETAEETGITNDNPLYLFGYTSNLDKIKNTQFIRMIYLCKNSNNLDIIIDPSEHTDFAWVKIKDLSSYKIIKFIPDLIKNLGKYKNLLNEIQNP